MSVHQAQVNFINASRFAVIGRVLTDRSRWDNKVLRWYKDHDLPVTPILPSEIKSQTEIVEELAVISNPLELENLSETSISIIINPVIGLSILKSLYPPLTGERVTRSTSSYSNKGPKGVWFQPGAESDEIRAYVREMGLEGRVVCAGNHECILVEGDRLLERRKVHSGGKL